MRAFFVTLRSTKAPKTIARENIFFAEILFSISCAPEKMFAQLSARRLANVFPTAPENFRHTALRGNSSSVEIPAIVFENLKLL
jgi:hypothetical protein